MIILTATTKDQSHLTDIQKASAMLFGVSSNEHLCLDIPKDYPKHPSWFKIRALLTHLPYHDHILWMDSDSLFLRKEHWAWMHEQVKGIESPVALCKDGNGWNCGVMLWKRCPKAFEALWRIYDSYEHFQYHPWFEQGAFHTMADSFGPHLLPKRWNQYDNEVDSESLILHLPAKDFEYRKKAMGYRLSKLQTTHP